MKMSGCILRCTVALLLALVCGCISRALAGGQPQDVAEALRLNQRQWTAQQIKHYQFVFRRLCFCPPDYTRPAIIYVRDGKIQMVRYADGDQQLVSSDQFQRYPTIDELFATIQKALEQPAYRISATYHARRGFPTSIFIDYLAGVVDDEQGFRVSNLKVGK